MTETVIYVKLDPEEVDIDDVEDFLATDDLFVEYFNAFLALPTFPSPLCFNKDTGGFEVVTDAKKELARQIKAAVRSQKRRPKIYSVVKKHSYIDIPLIPIEDAPEQDNLEINTSFTVTTLNKEQGIHWVKQERLPAFVESDLYLEYRLAKLISQTKVTGDHGEYILLKIDYVPRVKKVKKKVEEEIPKVDPKEQMMKDMFVSLGNTSTMEADNWFTMASSLQGTNTTFTSSSQPHAMEMTKRPHSARPASAFSMMETYRAESGMGTSIRSSVYSSAGMRSNLTSKQSMYDEDIYSSKLFATDGKPMTPRPSDNICAIADDQSSTRTRPFSATVYSCPKYDMDNDNESGLGLEEEVRFDLESLPSTREDVMKPEPKKVQRKESITFESIDDLGVAIVGAVLTRSVAKLSNMSEEEVLSSDQISQQIPRSKGKELTMEMLERVSLVEEVKEDQEEDKDEGSDEDDEVKKVTEEEKKKRKKKEEDSDNDSLLDSEEDYEEQDDFFRSKKQKTFDLSNRKGIEAFRNFLKGTAGEKNWCMWIDIDRIQFMKKRNGLMAQDDILEYLQHMRDTYHKHGAPYELTAEQKMALGLTEPSSWTLEKLQLVQNKIAEPLILYWAPRFLLKQTVHLNPDKNQLYSNLNQLKPKNAQVYPDPPACKLLPLRPKSCVPRLQEPVIEQQHLDKTALILKEVPKTSPPVGFKRTYNLPVSSPRKPGVNKENESKLTAKLSSTKSELSRPKSAHPRSPVSENSSRPVSSKAPSSKPSRPSSANSDMSEKAKTDKQEAKATPRSRPSSARSSKSDISTASSEFLGGRRMEQLLQTLYHERTSGGFFQKYIDRSQNKIWINCLHFWNDLQEYHLLFYADALDPSVLTKKARTIYSQYIVVGSPRSIGCQHSVRMSILRKINPPYEDLFDAAEEYSFSVLYVPYQEMVELDMKTYGKVELIEVKKHLETRSKYVLNLQKKGLIKERVITPDDPMEGYEDPVYDENLLKNIPEQFQDYTLEKLVHNRIELEHFRQFLNENYASMDLLCWMDIEQFRRMPQNDERKRDVKAKELKNKYLNKKYFFGPNSPAGKESQDKIMADAGGWGKLLNDRPPNSVLLDAQKFVRDRLEKKWLPLFLVTPEFAERAQPKTGMDDVVDDVMVQKRKKSQAVQKLLESKFVSSTKEIIMFRNALLNPVTSLQFRRFVSIKGDNYENDVLFWLEVQKFKEANHTHADDAFVMGKINTIINCFIESPIPPSLQIDIPSDMADRIIEHKYERNPYLFRESQFSVFRVLFPLWNDFCEFRSNLADDKVLPTIERQRRHARHKEKMKLKLEEEKALKEAERRAALGLGPNDDLEAYHDPFAHQGEGSEVPEEDDDKKQGKDKVSWSYSSYMNALQREEILNNTDETTFSSLFSDTGSLKGSEGKSDQAGDSKAGEQQTTASSVPNKEVKSEQTQTSKNTEKKKTAKFNVPPEPNPPTETNSGKKEADKAAKEKKEAPVNKPSGKQPTMATVKEEAEDSQQGQQKTVKKVKVKLEGPKAKPAS